MKQNFLAQIYAETEIRVQQLLAANSMADLYELAEQSPRPRNFIEILRQAPKPQVIAELKRQSPTLGPFAAGISLLETASAYLQNRAAALSVLTEPRHFGGSMDDLRQLRIHLPQAPLLRKDFIIDSAQLLESRIAGADAVLLIKGLVDSDLFAKLYRQTLDLGLTPLVEVHSESELRDVLGMGATLIGVNNRDLRTLKVDLNTSAQLIRLRRPDCYFISESGLDHPQQILNLQSLGFDGFLIGSALTKTSDPGLKLKELRGALP